MKLRILLVGCISASAGLCTGLVLVGPGIAQTPPGYSRDLPGEPPPPTDLPPNEIEAIEVVLDETAIATAKAEASEAEYRIAIKANREKPGTVSASDVERLYRTYSDEMLSALRKQVQSLRDELRESKRPRFRPVASRN